MSGFDLSQKTVLVLAPESAARSKLCRRLLALGMRVFEASTQSEGLDFLTDESTAVDLVIVTLELPDLVGVGFARIINTWLPELPVLFLAPYDDRRDSEFRLAARCARALSFPPAPGWDC